MKKSTRYMLYFGACVIFGILTFLNQVHSFNINFLSYGDDSFKLSKARIEKEAQFFGEFNKILIQGPKDIDEAFSKKFSDVLKLPRGGGYWIWKMHLIEKALTKWKKTIF